MTKRQAEQFDELNKLPEHQIDTPDLPEMMAMDWASAVRGERHEFTGILRLDEDVAAHFKDSAAVNHALRMLIQLANKELVDTRFSG